jgi:hypothetical protein
MNICEIRFISNVLQLYHIQIKQTQNFLMLWSMTSIIIITTDSIPNDGRRGRDGMVVGFTTIYASSAYHH